MRILVMQQFDIEVFENELQPIKKATDQAAFNYAVEYLPFEQLKLDNELREEKEKNARSGRRKSLLKMMKVILSHKEKQKEPSEIVTQKLIDTSIAYEEALSKNIKIFQTYQHLITNNQATVSDRDFRRTALAKLFKMKESEDEIIEQKLTDEIKYLEDGIAELKEERTTFKKLYIAQHSREQETLVKLQESLITKIMEKLKSDATLAIKLSTEVTQDTSDGSSNSTNTVNTALRKVIRHSQQPLRSGSTRKRTSEITDIFNQSTIKREDFLETLKTLNASKTGENLLRTFYNENADFLYLKYALKQHDTYVENVKKLTDGGKFKSTGLKPLYHKFVVSTGAGDQRSPSPEANPDYEIDNNNNNDGKRQK